MPPFVATSRRMAARSTPARPRPISAAYRAAARRRPPRPRRRAAISSRAARSSSPARRACRWFVTLVRCRRAPPRPHGEVGSAVVEAGSPGLTIARWLGRRAEPRSPAIGRRLRATCSFPLISCRAASSAAARRRKAAGGQGRAGARAVVADDRGGLSRHRRGRARRAAVRYASRGDRPRSAPDRRHHADPGAHRRHGRDAGGGARATL